MKIIKLTLENVMKVSAAQITPNGTPVVTISGKNEQGKSTIINSIWLVLQEVAARKALKITEPIRRGAKKAVAVLDLGDIVVTKTWTSNIGTGDLKIVPKAGGSPLRSPQSVLDALCGHLAFDPEAFARMEPKKQRDILLDLVKIDLDLNQWAKERQDIYDARTISNKFIDELTAQIKLLGDVPANTPDQEIQIAAVMIEMQEAQKQKTANDEKRHTLENMRGEAQRIKQTIDTRAKTILSLQDQLSELQNAQETEQALLHSTIEKGKALAAEVEKLVDPDMTGYQEKMTRAEETNRLVRIKVNKKALQESFDGYKKASDDNTVKIAALDKKKEDALKSAKFPIEGISFDDNEVYYKDIPFSQGSDAERLTVSVAMAMALNPTLKVIRISNASLLDSAHRHIIYDMVEKANAGLPESEWYQVWEERVDETGTVGIVISDGQIVAVNDKEAVNA